MLRYCSLIPRAIPPFHFREPLFICCAKLFIRWQLSVDTELILRALTAIERRPMLH